MDLVQESPSPVDVKQLMFNNLQLVGLDAQALEASSHIPFNKFMFDLPNKRGAEIVLHFLFQRLNPSMCKESFRDCWPIHDKKTEQTFRKTCSNWLINIAKDDPDCHLPRINASLFMSPGGDKFYQLLFHFSGYVLQKILEKDLGLCCSELLRYPSLTSQSLQQGEVMKKNMICSSIRHRNGFFSTPQLTLKASTSWTETVDEFVKENRKMSKEIRELDYKTREEQQIAVQTGQFRGSPVKSRGHLEQLDPNFDPRTIKRAQKIQQVRDMWKQLDDFEECEAAEREVIESIVENTINKHRIDAGDISINVPDRLLRECAEEIRRRLALDAFGEAAQDPFGGKKNVDNTYQCGKLNLKSVIQLWNLCLHLYLEKLQQVGVPKFGSEVKKLESQFHAQQSYLENAHTLRERMQEKIPGLKSSVNSLRERLDEIFFNGATPASVRSTSLGYGLVEPSPQQSFSPEYGQTPAVGVGIPNDTQQVETPEAVAVISQEVESRVRQGPAQLFRDTDIQLDLQLPDRNISAIPEPASTAAVPRQKSSKVGSSRPASASSVCSSRGNARSQVERGTPKVSARTEEDSFPGPCTMTPSYRSTEQSPDRTSYISCSMRPFPSPTNSDIHTDGQTGKLTPTDYLVEEIMGESEVLTNCISGLEAFHSHDRVGRTPVLVEENKENIKPNTTLADTPIRNKKEDQNRSRTQVNDSLTADDIHRLDMEFSVRQKDSIETEIPESELEGEFDNDTELSEERLLVIDRSIKILQEEAVQVDLVSCEHPKITSHQLCDDSPKPVVIEKSLQLSPAQQDSWARKGEIVQQKLGGTMRSPLSEEIRKMFKEAIADTVPLRLESLEQNHRKDLVETQKSVSGSSRNSFADQVQLEDLVVGEAIVRRDSDNFYKSDCHFQQNRSDIAQSLRVDDILQRVKAMEETILGRGTPIDSELELPVMDPNSRLPDSDDEAGAPVKIGDISWEHTENLDEIEMPDLAVDQDIDSDEEKDLKHEVETQKDIDLDFRPVNLDSFFESKTPELPKRGCGIPSGNLQSSISTEQLPKFPQDIPEDEPSLITFTP